MFEHLTAKARNAIKLADRMAKQFGQDYVGTEHILLGIMMEGTGQGARQLQAHGVDMDKLKQHIEQIVHKMDHDDLVLGRLPSTPHLQNVVTNAIEQAQKLKHPVICTEHLLLALLKEKGSVAYVALQDLGVDLQALRSDLAKTADQSTCGEA